MGLVPTRFLKLQRQGGGGGRISGKTPAPQADRGPALRRELCVCHSHHTLLAAVTQLGPPLVLAAALWGGCCPFRRLAD